MRLLVRQLCAVFLLVALAQAEDARVAALEKKLAEAAIQMAQFQSVIEVLRSELAELKRDAPSQAAAPSAERTPAKDYAARILLPDLGHDERESELSGRPELFIQSR